MNCQSCPFIARWFILPTQTPPCTNSCCKPLLHIIFRLCGAKLEHTLWIEPQTESSGQSGCQSVGDFTLTRAHLRAKRRRISDDLQRSSQSNRKALTVTRGVNYTAALSDVLTGCHWRVSDWAAAPDIIHWMETGLNKVTNVNISNPQTPVARCCCCSGNRNIRGWTRPSERRCAHPPRGKKIDPRVTSPCPEHIEWSVESSQPLTSSHRVHLSAEITASKIDSTNPAEEEGGRRSAAAGWQRAGARVWIISNARER